MLLRYLAFIFKTEILNHVPVQIKVRLQKALFGHSLMHSEEMKCKMQNMINNRDGIRTAFFLNTGVARSTE